MNLREKLQNLSRGDLPGNPASNYRKERFEIFLKIVGDLFKEEISILDIGGTEYYWANLEIEKYPNVRIILLNKYKIETKISNIKSETGDGCNLVQFRDQQFDLVYSNSVIEHVGSYLDQKKFADEVIRVGKRYFIQTPNFYFPVEPHFLTPAFQFLPVEVRAFFIRHFDLGWFDKCPDYNESVKISLSIRLLRKKELMELFPGSNLSLEKYLLFTKSFMVYYGFS